MNYSPAIGNKAVQHYGQVAVHSGVQDASPHRLIQMLIDGALEKIIIAKNHMQERNIAEKGRHISWAISIIEGLRSSLDTEAGGEIAANLNDLYEYMENRLTEANLKDDEGMLDEVAGLMRQIKGAWDAISPDAPQQSVAAGEAGSSGISVGA